MPEASLQQKIFDLILSRYARRADAVSALCALLDTTKDPVYRRLRGDTPLTPDELALLARHYHLSLDAVVYGQGDNLLCNFNAFSQQVRDFADYLQGYVTDLEKMRRLTDLHLYYASAEIPVMTYHFLPELICFKLYIWGRTTWNLHYLRQRPFDFELLTPPVLRLSKAVLDHYLHLPSTELWSLNIADNTLSQIEYHVTSGGFSKSSDALVLCDKLLVWAAHMKEMAASGRKFPLGSHPSESSCVFSLYHNELVFTNNTALAVSDAGKAVYSAFCNPNFIKSSDPKLCDYTRNWFDSVIAKSNPISQSAEKSRDWFFQGLAKKIERVKNRITAYIEENE
ncbi:MAG: hypothetical protein JNL02_11040 [Saprospiraceae bacterium]|nr:hypothetical protein [Saprospiraceae bacterium]